MIPKIKLCLSFALIALGANAEPRTWTLAEAGRIKFQSGGMSFVKGGKIDAEFLRVETTNVFLRVKDGGDGCLPIASLSKADHAYLEKIKVMDTARFLGVSAVEAARLDKEAQEQETKNRIQAEAAAKGLAKKEAQDSEVNRHYNDLVKIKEQIRDGTIRSEPALMRVSGRFTEEERRALKHDLSEKLKSDRGQRQRLEIIQSGKQ